MILYFIFTFSGHRDQGQRPGRVLPSVHGHPARHNQKRNR
jgi:hypothetical protein